MSLIQQIKSIFVRDKKIRGNGILYTSHGDNCWGNAISFRISKDDKLCDELGKTQRFHGWKNRRPITGDYIQVPMKSGMHFLFEITEHEHCRDPIDMFFCTGMFLGYSEDNPEIINLLTVEGKESEA